MSSGAISSREDFARYYESGDIRTEVLEKVGKAVKEHQKFESQDRLDELLKTKA